MPLPTDAQARKAVPIFSGVIRYFPRALAAVAEVSRVGNEQHNPGQPLHWDKAKSTDEGDALMRHQMEAGTIDSDGQRHSAKVAWRALAQLERELEAAENRELLEQKYQTGAQNAAGQLRASYNQGGLGGLGSALGIFGGEK